MSFETRFTEAEQHLLVTVPSMIGSSMAFAEGSGLGTIKEVMASAKSVMAGLKDYPQNEIIAGVLPNLEDRKEAMARAKEFRSKAVDRLKERGVKNHEQMRTLLIEDCQALNTILKEKARPDEAKEYKDWALSVAAKVANAAKEGGFLGFGGEKISKGERELMADLSSALESENPLA